jgi:hypothetical protein
LQSVNSALKKFLPKLDETLVRVGAFKLACLPFTEDMKIKLEEWKKLLATKIAQDVPQNDTQKEEALSTYDSTWDPLMALLRKMDAHKAASRSPDEYFFVLC